MADDFDKEAPDAMDHQIVGETLPDFSVVVIKNEVINFYDSEFECTISSVQYRKPFFQEEIGSNALEALSSEITDTEYCQSNILNSNKIILGSKAHGEQDHFAKSAELYQEKNVFLANDTQLNPNSIDENYFEELVTSYEPKVELHDIQSYLHKSRRFCESCGILFPEPNTYEMHMQMYHTKTNLAVSSHKNNDLAKRRIYKCTLCDKKFVAPHVLRNHLNNIHKLKNKNETKTRKRRYKRALCNTKPQHRCYICGLKFVAPHVLKRHLINVHKLNYDRVPGKQYCQSIMNTVNGIKSPSVNRDITSGWSNTCFHCKKLFDTQKSLIEHLYDILQMKRKNTEIVPVLKSILFKCNKCDINFTSSQFAANHAEHMEMLINWKCTICNRIFKNEDALSHERQHSVTNNFLVYNLEDLDVTKFLYKCSKCAVHFTESNFLYHFRDCGLEYSKFVNCNICNMSLDYNLKPLHESDKHTGPNDYTIIESDVISDIPVKSTANKYQAKEKLKELVKSFREVKVVLQKIDSSKLNKLDQLNTEKWCSDECLSDFESGANYEEIRNKAPELQRNKNETSSTTIRQSKDVDLRRRRNMTFYFCKTCKCFVTKHRKTVHLEARCKNISTEACEHCGLMFTTASLMTHRQLHKEKKDLSINHFKFFNLYDGRPINPAKPEALNTKRTAKTPKRHGRRNLTYHYCETCKCFLTKFNNAKLHKRKLCKNLSKTSCSYCGLMFTRASMMTHRRLHEERKDLTLKNLKFFNLHNGQPMNPPVTELTSINQSVNNEAEVESIERYKNIDNWHTKLNLAYYYCETCKCYITKFRKDAHLKGRCKKLAKMSCKHCGLMFTNASLVTHLRLHNEKADLSLKDFNFFNLYNGQPMNPPITKVTDSTRHVNTEVEILNIKRPVASEDACLLRLINKEAEPENGNLYTDIRARVVNENLALNIEAEADNQTSTQRIGAEYKVNNEGEALHFERPINIEAEVRNENQSENIESEAVNATPLLQIQAENKVLFTNNESESLHFKRPTNIEPKVGAIIQLVINKSQAENYLPSNIEADIECRLGVVNNEDRVSNIQVPLTTKTNDETEIEKLKLLVHNETENIKRFLSDLNNGPQVESLEMPIDSEVESSITTLQLLLNSGTTSNNKTDDKNENRPEEHDAEVGHIIQPLSSTVEVAKIKRPVNLDVWRSKSNLTYHYCKNCNCYVTQFRKQTHLKARCRNLAKVTCKDCDLMFTSGSIMTHKRLHIENKNLTLKNFTFFNLYNGKPMNPSIPENENMKETVNAEPGVVNMNQPEVVNKQTVNPEDEVVCIKQPSNNEPKVPHSKTSKNPEDWRRKLNLTLYFCETCKCFVTKYKKTAHVQENCMNMLKIPCKHCGLILSDTSFPLHKRLHEERKDWTLNHLKFFDLNSGQPMNPPIPEYPKCANCAVYFLTITAKNSHICSEVSSLTCHICEIKLSEAAFKLHMTFHQYATDNTNIIESNMVESATKLDRIVVNDITENSVTNTSNHKSNETDFHYSLDVSETPLQRSSDMYSIVYCCRNCSVSVDTYDKAVEHSQTHYETYEHETRTIHCNSCNLKIDEACYMAHQNLHESETLFKFLHFDSYYLPAENNLWIKHIFKTLPNEEVLDILRNSIYRFECRIKMDVIQKGDPNFTVYKCDQCNCFIDPTTLFKHSDYACFKLRNHPCTVCGIAFNSSASRIDHEKIHIRAGLTTESYRIVIFNRERDLQVNRSFCLRKNYVLYQCRYCDVIIEKPREDIHKCDFTNVKNCPHCALLLNIKDYESHLNIHENFISFNYSNMKVVLRGESNSLEIRSENNLRSKFKGVIYDYKMFVCNKCEICIKNEDLMPKHICRFGKQRLKCLKCGLYFSVGRLKTHMRRHEQDPDFIRSNMCLISFDPCTLDQNKNATKLFKKDKNCELSDSNTDSDLECVSANDTGAGNDTKTADVTTEIVEEETVRIYKCSCELHFLNEDSIFRHFGTCRSNSKIIKLKCHKCGLLFTSNVLFTHMLAHHNNKGRRYKYDVIKVCYN